MRNPTHILLSSILIIFLAGCNPPNPTPTYQLVYKNDKEGNTVSGSKADLINAIRLGASIKIGWGSQSETRTIEHLSEPIWIAIPNGEEVIAYLDPQVFARLDWSDLTATYSDSLSATTEWRVAITTKGEFDAIWYDRKENRITRRVPQNHVMSWYVKDVYIGEAAIPLFEPK